MITVCLAPKRTLDYYEGGGHLWVYLNWALGLRALGCRVIWLEVVKPGIGAVDLRRAVCGLKERLKRYGLDECVALYADSGRRLPAGRLEGCMDFDAASGADLLVNLRYDMPARIVERFRRTALLDIDPGLLQLWMSTGQIEAAPHDLYFSIGETVGRPGARFPDAGLKWNYTPPCVSLEHWPVRASEPGAPFTTLAHWHAGSWLNGQAHAEDKRSGFQPFLSLPGRTGYHLELALDLRRGDWEWGELEKQGWSLKEARRIASTPWGYQRYIRRSLAEFSCAKPSCIRLRNAWVSDRTLCYLASGRPAVVQHTGRSRILPKAAGMFRFRTPAEAIRSMEKVLSDYERQSRLARVLAEEHFDAKKAAASLLERALA